MQTLSQDVRYGLRMLRKRPGFTLIAVLALGLGIGANSALFSIINAVLLRPLAYEESERLVVISEASQQNPAMFVSYPNFLDWKEQNRVFEALSAIRSQSFNLAGTDDPERVEGRQVSADFFSVLRVRPARGRAFLPEEDKIGADPVVVLSHGLWRGRFNADPRIIGQTISLDNRAFTVIGIMPEDFRYGAQQADVWVPIGQWAVLPGWMKREVRPGARVLGRLKPGVSLSAAQAEMTAIAAQLAAQYPQTNTGVGVRVASMYESVVGETRPALLVLLGAVGFVLLIACANVANLILARAASRQKEFAIRAALGASRWRIVRQTLTESALLALLGGALGLLLTVWGVDLLIAASANSIPRATEISVDLRVLAFTLSLSSLTGIVFGLVPALQGSRPKLQETLKEGERGSGAGLGGRFRGALVVVETALALVLLIGAGLLIKSFMRLRGVDPGFDPANVLTMRVPLPRTKYPEEAQVTRFYRQLLERVEALPGVEAGGIVNELPLAGRGWPIGLGPADRLLLPPGEEAVSDWGIVSPDYFRVMKIQLLKGRTFTEGDAAQSPPVVIIDEEVARHFWPNEEALGKQLSVVGSEPHEVVGVVRHVRSHGLETTSRMKVYTASAQTPMHAMNLAIRTTSSDSANLARAIAGEVRALDKDQPIYHIRTMGQILAESVAPRRFNVILLGLFASVALVLASVGLYGVMSYSVAQRTREIGVRMALGAQESDVLRLVVRQGMVLTASGVASGLAASLALTRVMSSLLYGVSANDPATFVGVPLLLIGVAFMASYLPARRAARVDPMIALRYE